MGIKNLTKFIKEKCQDAYVTENINALSFKKIAIDTPMLMYKYKSMNAVKMVENNGIYYNPDGWLWSFIHFIYSLRKHDIHPIFILEGGYPEEKNKTRMARKKDREDVKKKTLSLEESISSYATSLRLRPDMNKEDIPQDLKEEWNKIAKKNNLSFEDFDFETVIRPCKTKT